MDGDPTLVSGADWGPLLAALDRGVVRVADGRVVAANAAFGRWAGLPPQELAGRAVAELFADVGDRPLDELQAGDGFAVRDLSGRLRPISLARVSAGLWLVLDRERESRLEREVWRLASEKRSQPPAATDAPLGGEQIGMIEHEIRTAVTAVRGYLRWLGSERDRLLEPEHWTFVREARRAIERIGPLLDNLLELARSGEALPSGRKPLRLHEVLELAVRTARPLLADRGVLVECELGAVPDALLGDPERLEQVFVNLLANAAAFSPEGARVRVASDLAELDDGAWLQVAIRDEGPGVTRGDAERIFRPFVRGPRAQGSSSAGVGLGLAICRRIVSAHGGRIEAVPELGYGLFRVSLPSGQRGSER
ncbi:MAG TPA: PAS domain-containing sensor histidine kinase [Myxococcota bacterium]|nr:PAS domain-containing sensor histidine kinase [Myxococcota bacterium]